MDQPVQDEGIMRELALHALSKSYFVCNFLKFRARFANYDGAKIERLAFSGNGTKVEVAIVTAQHRISIVAEGSHDDAIRVYGPTAGGEFRPYIKVRIFLALLVEGKGALEKSYFTRTTTWGIPSLAMFCLVFFPKSRLAIVLHSSYSISPTAAAGGTCQKCSTKHRDCVIIMITISRRCSAPVWLSSWTEYVTE